jgi:hypothetical protein
MERTSVLTSVRKFLPMRKAFSIWLTVSAELGIALVVVSTATVGFALLGYVLYTGFLVLLGISTPNQ